AHGMMASKRLDLDVKRLKGDWTEASAYNAAKSWLRLTTSKEMHISLVGCQNDAMAVGARKAFDEIADSRERDQLLSLPFTGCDGVPSKGQDFVRRGILEATVITPALTGVALEMLAETMRSGVQPAEHTLLAPKSFPPVEELVKKWENKAQAAKT